MNYYPILSSIKKGAGNAVLATAGLLINFDPDNSASYPGSGPTLTDLSGNGNHATLVNGVAYGSSPLGYLNFDGVNDYLDCITPSLTNQITIEIYINISFFTGATLYICGVEASYRILVGNTSIAWVCSTNATGWYGPGSAINMSYLPGAQWVCVTATFNGVNNKLYYNGVLQTTGANISGNIISPASNLTFMKSAIGGIGYGREKVGAIRVYSIALTAAEVLSNFNYGRSRYGI